MRVDTLTYQSGPSGRLQELCSECRSILDEKLSVARQRAKHLPVASLHPQHSHQICQKNEAHIIIMHQVGQRQHQVYHRANQLQDLSLS